MVVLIAFVDALHGFGVSIGALIVVEFIRVRVKDRERQDVVAFAGGRRLEGASFGEEFGASGEVRFAGAIPEFVVKGHCLSPVSHCAARISFGDFLELRVGYFVFEGMQKGDAALELGLDFRNAGGRKGDGAQFFIGVVMVLCLLSGEQIRCERQSADESEKSECWGLHDDSLQREVKSVATARGDVNPQRSLAMGVPRNFVTRAIQQWSQHLHPRKCQRDQQGDHAPPTIVGLGLDYVWGL